jgi:hypothetical protein
LIKVYLSGGTVTDWQDEVIDRFVGWDNVEFYNPKTFEVGADTRPSPSLYSPMNKHKIDECDIVFAFLESSNPTPINIVAEVGYALGRGKIVVFCNNWTENVYKSGDLRCLMTEQDGVRATWFKPHYLAQVMEWVDFYEEDFGIAIELLKKLISYE